MAIPILLLLLFSGSMGVMLHSIYVLGKGGVYPSRRIVVKRLQTGGGVFFAAVILLLAVWLI